MQALIKELRDFYRFYDLGQGKTLTDEEIDKYHKRMLGHNRLVYEFDSEGKLLGYIETWRVTSDQIGRILFNDRFDVFTEDIISGPICYVANITIRPESRRGNLLNLLKGRAIEKNFTATHFCGEAAHGKAKSFKIFTKKEYWLKKEVVSNV